MEQGTWCAVKTTRESSPPDNKPIRVLVADKHLIVRQGLAMEIAQHEDLILVGEAADGRDAAQKALALRPDVLTMDMGMPERNAIQVLHHLHQQTLPPPWPPKVLIFSGFGDKQFVWSALAAGAKGYLLKSEPAAQVVAGIRTLAAGRTILSEQVQTLLVKLIPNLHRELTNREVEVLKLLARGMSDDDIAATLNIRESTVRNHLNNAYRKIPLLNSRAEAISWTWINRLNAD